jgi:cobalt-zinc-cadmium resistance protein CzcA
MLDKIIQFSVRNKLIVGILTLILVCCGVYSLRTLPIDAVPDITNNQVQVITTSPSLAAQEVERLITFPVETAMSTIAHTIEIRSISRFGLSAVTVVFKDEVDIYWARQQVSERLQKAVEEIPQDAGRPELGPVSTGLGEIYQYLLRPAKGYENAFSVTELRTLQDWVVRRQLLGTVGVADVSSFGGFVKQYEIGLDQQKLKSFNLSVGEVFEALEANNQNTGGAYIDKKPNAYFIRSEGLIGSLEDIEKIAVRSGKDGIPVRIRDVATVQFGHAVRYGAMTRNNEGEVVGGLVLMLKGANSSEVIQNVKQRVAQIRKTLPKGVEMEAFLDRTKLVDNAIRTVSTNLLEGALIVIFVLVLFLGNIRAGLVVASVIPLAMLFAVCMMKLFGVSGNLMSLGAIDFGLIVDGAVIIVEATLHHIMGQHYNNRLTQEEMDKEVYEASSKIRNSAAFGEIIILIVYLPILALAGVEGKMFRPMAETVSFAILGAFILSLTYVPMVSALFLSKNNVYKTTVSDRLMAFLERQYVPALRQALKWWKFVLIGVVILFGVSVWIFQRMGGEFIPQLDEGDFAVEVRVLTGSSLSESIETVQKAAFLLKDKFPDEVVEVVGKIGSSEIPTDPMPIEAADLMVILSPRDSWTTANGREQLAKKMQDMLQEHIVGVSFGFQQPIQMRFNELMTGVKQDVAIKIFGEDLDVLALQAQKIGKVVGTTSGAEDLYIESISGLPQIVVDFDREALAKMGISIQLANATLRAAFAGTTAGLVYEGEKRFPLVIRMGLESRQRIEDVRNLFITTSNGTQIPLSQVADVQIKMGINQIQREDAKRRVVVAFNVRGRDVESIVNELESKIAQQVKLPTGYYVTYGGQFQNLKEANARLVYAVPAALMLIFVLLYFTFRSLRQALLILTAIPLSAIGGVWALTFRDLPFSISAGIGFIALFGVAVLNGIVLIGEFNFLRKTNQMELMAAVLQGTRTRLRPVLMTALVASLGFLPMALSGSAGAEVQRPLATVVIGGLLTATFLTLFILPILYIYIEKRLERRGQIGYVLGLLICFGVLGMPQTVKAQKVETPPRVLSITEAISEGLAQNLGVKSGFYQVALDQSMLKTAVDVPKTDLSWMGGQYNSTRFDHNFTVNQNVPNPVVSKRKRALLEAQVSSSESNLVITKANLIRAIKTTYYEWMLFHQKEGLLREEMERMGQFVAAAKLRFNTGETNQLELSMVESQTGDIEARLIQNNSEKIRLQHQLALLLNSKDAIIPDISTTQKWDIAQKLSEERQVGSNPLIQYLRSELNISQKSLELEKASLLPEFSVGYFNQSLIGTTNESGTETYGGWKRFQGAQIGVAIPIFNKASKARIQAAGIRSMLIENELAKSQVTLENQWKQGVELYNRSRLSLDLYETKTLKLSVQIRATATKAYAAGEIGYIEYAEGLSRALSVQDTYLDLLGEYNQAAIQIEFLLDQNGTN